MGGGEAPIGFGVVGAGTIGRVHVRNVAARSDARLCWVVDVDRSRASALGEAHGARIATTLDDMLADPAVHVVVIASSTDAHEENVLATVHARKAILCEKPIGNSLDGARRCVDAAQEQGTIAAIGFNRRFDASHRAVHDRIRAGDIGGVESLHIVSRSYEATPPAAAHRAGGLLREKGTHFYDLACWLAASDPVEVYAAGDCLFDRGYADYGDVDTAALTLRLASGALATFSFSRRTAYGYDETIEVFGARGMLQSERSRPRGVSLYQGPRVTADGIDANWYDRFAPTYAAELDALIAAVRTQSPGDPSLVDGLRAQAVAEAAIESLAQRAPVTIRKVWR
jgi:myo-inositol 2-dehydrogenase/D-chiro-inositol 1-dehydrogenase